MHFNTAMKPTAWAVALACLNIVPAQAIEEITVTGTREGRAVAETPATVDVIKGDAVREMRATHPSQVMGRVPGVWVNVTGGEGHTTAIRQPISTNPVYLYLEDGVPVRSTGFFNHNALYEVNLPMSGGVEVSKGPGSALYGSDAIGGIVNVLSRKAPRKPELELTGELGAWGWRRLLLAGGDKVGDGGYRADVNVTRTDGWREHTGYDRQSGTLRLDQNLAGDATLKVVAAFSNIDQQTAGTSTISLADYQNNPTKSYTPISFRKVKAVRLSAAYEKDGGGSLLSITPYLRSNSMDLLANWSLSYDPTVYTTENNSYGLLLKYRQDYAPLKARLIAGMDIDVSPGSRKEDALNLTASGSGYTKIYTAYTVGQRIYDYDVTYKGISPYVQGELSPFAPLRVTAGLRYDKMSYQYENKQAAVALAIGSRQYGHAADASPSYGHWSPKLGATWAFSENLNGFVSASHAFRAPSEGQLFRPSADSTASRAQAAAQAALNLKPVKANNLELGLRGKAQRLNWEVSAYDLHKRDDILSYKDPLTTATTAVNAGRTRHRGIEFGLGAELVETLRVDLSLSQTRHTYEEWIISGTANYSGKEMESAPRTLANTRLGWRPALLGGGRLELEWIRLGSYWLDQANTQKYAGHSLFNLRASGQVAKSVDIYANLTNLTDRRYAESASLSGTNPVLAPGLPRALTVGVQFKW